jgi:hypothetical protein
VIATGCGVVLGTLASGSPAPRFVPVTVVVARVETRMVPVPVTATPTATPTLEPHWATRTAEAKTPHPVFPTPAPETATGGA